MNIKIALIGNPNSGKTTLFNALTGSNQFVGNWPGVTVEKKEGKLKNYTDITVIDLPGIYSLSPYSSEEVIARNYLINEQPDVILNIIDGTNLERNLYLTNQLAELGIPLTIAVNMIDVIEKNGDKIDIPELSRRLGCKITEISALKNIGIKEAAEAAITTAKNKQTIPVQKFSDITEYALSNIENNYLNNTESKKKRWYAVKVFERDKKALEQLNFSKTELSSIEKLITRVEKEFDDDSESIITNERYNYIASLLKNCYFKKNVGKLTASDKIDRIVTNRFAALPIFAAVMFLVYFVSVSTVGAAATEFINDGIFGDGFYLFGSEIWVPGIPVILSGFLESVSCAGWLHDLIIDGIVAGVGSVLGFVPQMLILFLFLAFLEACGYMSRIAFIMDRIFRKFGLSGKSFIPILIGTGCGVPGIMASRTIENEADRRMTIITTTFIPCGAKLPVIALISGAVFKNAWWVAPSAYFIGILSILLSGLILKKTKIFSKDPSPFIIELPAYHLPTVKNLLNSTWERGWSFIKKAGTTILLATIIIWFASNFGFVNGTFEKTNMNESILAKLGSAISFIFIPLGWGNWQSASATITGLFAKENVVSTFGVLLTGLSEISENGQEIEASISKIFMPLSAYSFLIFNLLCAPCIAAMNAIRREMNSIKWTCFAIGYQCVFAYCVSFVIYQLGMVFTGNGNILGTFSAILIIMFAFYMLFKKNNESNKLMNYCVKEV